MFKYYFPYKSESFANFLIENLIKHAVLLPAQLLQRGLSLMGLSLKSSSYYWPI